MPLLSIAEQALVRNLVHTPSITGEQLVNVYRNAPITGGRVGAPVLAISALPVRIRPSSQDPRMLKLMAQLGIPVNAASISHLGKAAITADVQTGDEWRTGATKYKVESAGDWQNATLVSLAEVRTQT